MYISNEFKEICRYIHIGKYIGYQSHFQHIPIDLYRNNNMFLNPYEYLKLGEFKQEFKKINDKIQFL